MKNTGFCLLAMVVMFGTIFISCETDAHEDDWKPVSTVNEIAGTWEGSFTIDVPAQGDYHDMTSMIFDVPIPATSVFFEYFIMEYKENADTILNKTKTVYDTLLEDTIMTNSGYTKDSLWANLEAFYEPIKDYMNVIFDKYYVITEESSGVNDLQLTTFYLDKDKKRLKMVVPLSQTYKKEVILEKK